MCFFRYVWVQLDQIMTINYLYQEGKIKWKKKTKKHTRLESNPGEGKLSVSKLLVNLFSIIHISPCMSTSYTGQQVDSHHIKFLHTAEKSLSSLLKLLVKFPKTVSQPIKYSISVQINYLHHTSALQHCCEMIELMGFVPTQTVSNHSAAIKIIIHPRVFV